MQVTRWLGTVVAMLGLGAGVAWGGSEERLGTGGAPELRLPVGARALALAGSDLAMVKGAEALFYNPAGIAGGVSRTEVMASHTQYFADMKLNYVGFTQAVGFGTVGVAVKVLSIGEMIRTTEDAPDGTGDVFSPTFSNIGLSFGKQMTDRVNFGASMILVSERVLQTTANGVAFDFGFQYETGWRGIRLGMAMKSFGPNMQYGGSDFDRIIQFDDDDPQASGRNVRQQPAAFELPSTFRMSAGVPVISGDNPLLAFGTFSSNAFGRDDGCVALEWTTRKVLSLRGGYHYNGDSDQLFQWSYGLGVRVPMANAKLDIDYAGQPVNGGYFDDLQTVSLNLHF